MGVKCKEVAMGWSVFYHNKVTGEKILWKPGLSEAEAKACVCRDREDRALVPSRIEHGNDWELEVSLDEEDG